MLRIVRELSNQKITPKASKGFCAITVASYFLWVLIKILNFLHVKNSYCTKTTGTKDVFLYIVSYMQ